MMKRNEKASGPVLASGKAEYYKTAKIAKDLYAQYGECDMKVDTFVGLTFKGSAPNKMFKRYEAVFAVTKEGRFWGYVFESSLKDFVL